MDITPALLNLTTEWRDWASQPNIDPAEQRSVALRKFFNCVEDKNSSLDLSDLSLTSLPTIPEWVIELDVSDNQLTNLPNNLPKALTHLYVGQNQLTSLPEYLPEELLALRANANKLTALSDHLPKNLMSLNISENQIISLPSELPANLRLLNVGDNKLSALPDNLPSSLGVLFVDKNNLESLPNKLPNSLWYLKVSDNPLTALPNQLPSMLQTLEVKNAFLTALPNSLPDTLWNLKVSNNQITVLPAKLPLNLQVLKIDKNKLSVLPDQLPEELRELNVASNQLTNLTEVLPSKLSILAASHNQLKKLPQILPNTLRTLLVDDNQLTFLPLDLPSELTNLNVYCNQLKFLPDKLPPKLTILDVGDNRLKFLPDNLPVKLEQLYVNRNQLTKLPDHLPNSLIVLHASFNKLNLIANNLPNSLEHLFIAGNQLTSLSIDLPPGIIKLDVKRNQLTALPELPNGITELDVRHNQLTVLPVDLPTSLEALHAAYNKLTELPGRLPTNLLFLDVSYNQLTSLPNEFPNSLQFLYVQDNQLSQLPAIMPRFLTHIVLGNNQLTELPHFFADLIYLDASYNRLTAFPVGIPEDLDTLILHNNQLHALPADLSEDLTFFDVHNNQIATLPEHLPLMLEYCDFSGNPLDVIPTRFPLQFPQWFAAEHSIDISAEALHNWATNRNITADEANGRAIAVERITACIDNNSQLLDLSGLHLTRLPAHLPATISELRINNNQLSILPSHLPAKLKYLYAADNQLNALPGNLPDSLVYLDISSNQLTALPNTLPMMLQHLDAHNNLLTNLPTYLPDILMTLNVSHNQLVSLPNNLSNKLKKLDISSNQFTAFPDSLPNQLGHLNVSDNQLEKIRPASFSAKLKYLDASHNKLFALSDYLPDVLRYLNVSDNQLMVLPSNLPAKLKYLNVSGNQLKELPAHFPNKLLFLDIDNNPVSMGHAPISIAATEMKSHPQLSELPRSKYELILEWLEWLRKAPKNEIHARKTAFMRMSDCLRLQEKSLDLSNLKLTSLPDHLPNNLIALNVNDNQLTALPAKLPSTLQKLYADNNQLTSLPASLPAGLIQLDISHNQLVELTNNLPTTLLGIDISYNQLLRLPDHLPAGLLLLNADHNQLTFLPDSLPAGLTNLAVSNNQLKTLTNHLPNSIMRIDVSNNQLTALPDHMPNKLVKFNFTGNRLSAELMQQPINLTLAAGSRWDYASLTSDRKVSGWQLPAVNFQHEGESSRFNGQLIIQLENDPLVREAAIQLTKKHPQISVLVQLDSQGDTFIVHGNIEHLRPQTMQRWQLVGHGRESLLDGEHINLAWREAKSLAQQLKQLATDFGITVSPKHINLVGCSLADDKQQTSYVRQFADALDETIRPYTVSAYSSKLLVNEEGRKRLTEAGNKTTLVFNNEKNDWHIEKVAGKTVNNLAKTAIEPATLGAPSRLEAISYKLISFIKQAEQFQSTMSQFYHYHRLSLQKWLPLFSSFNKSKVQPGSYDLHFIHNETNQLKKLVTNNKHIIDFINKCNQYLEMIIKVYYYNGKTLALRSNSNITDVDSVHGLNAAFLIKELIPWFANKHRLSVVDGELSDTLSMALNIHTYLNLTQMVHGTVEDTVRLVNLYQMVAYQGQQATKGLLSPLFYGSYFLGGVFNIASIVLDSIELAHAQNDLQRAVFSAQLGVDIVNLAVIGIGIGASMLGATTVATFAGALAVPLAGVGVGITALAEAFGNVTHNVQIVGNYFADVDLAYKAGGYRLVTKKIPGSDMTITIMQPLPEAVITELDLRHNTLTYDSQYLYRNDPTHSVGSGHSNYFFFWPNRDLNRDKSQAINVRQGLGYQDSQNFKPAEHALLLPGTPISYLYYHYMTLPFVTARGDRGFDVLRKLEEDGRFDFDFYAFPGERAIYRLIPDYVATPIKVILDDRDRDLVMPTLPVDFQRYISYQLVGGEGEYRISLAKEGSVTLLSDNANTRWLLDARYLSPGTNLQVSEVDNCLYIDNVTVTLPKRAKQIVVVNKQGTYVFDEKSKQMHLTHVDGRYFNNSDALDKYLKTLADSQYHSSAFVIIDDYQPDIGRGNVGRAYYETARDRMIYTNLPVSADFLNKAILAKVEGDKAWFYRDTTIWQVEISTGQLLRQYLPFDFSAASHTDIRSYTIQENGQLLFVIEQNGMRCVYTVEDAALYLVAIHGSKALLNLLNSLKQLVDFIGQNKNPVLLLSEANQFDASPSLDIDQLDKHVSSATLIPSQLAEIVYLSGYNDGQRQHYWLITKGQYANNVIRLNLVAQSERDALPHADEVIANPAQRSASLAEFILVATATGESTGYYFYNPQTHVLYFQPDNGFSNSSAQLVASNIRSLFPINNKLFCQREDGIFSLLDNQGKNVLIGVSQDWLHQHSDRVILDLNKLIDAVPHAADYLILQGLQDREGNPVRAWYDSNVGCIVQAASSLDSNHELIYLGLSNDRREALIYDNDEQQQYRFLQPTNVTLTPTETGLLISDIPADPLWATFA